MAEPFGHQHKALQAPAVFFLILFINVFSLNKEEGILTRIWLEISPPLSEIGLGMTLFL